MPNTKARTIAILGVGPIALATAALLCERGHHPVLWSPRRKVASERQSAQFEGLHTGAFEFMVTNDCAKAVSGADAVFMAMAGNGQKLAIDTLVPLLAAGQPVIINSHSSLAGLYLAKRLHARDIASPIIAWNTTLTGCKKLADNLYRLVTIRPVVDMAVLPRSAATDGLALCNTLFGDHFNLKPNLMTIALSNLNAQNHIAIVIGNFTRMERGEIWNANINITPSIARLMEALDKERLQIAAAFGVTTRTLRQHYRLTHDVPELPINEVCAILEARGKQLFGPTTTQTRWILEDIPFGVVPLLALARMTGVDASLHQAGINIFSVFYARDFTAENDLLPELADELASPEDFSRLARDGYADTAGQ